MLLLDNILFWYIVIGISCGILCAVCLVFYKEKYNFLKGVVGILFSSVFWPVFFYNLCIATATTKPNKTKRRKNA